MATVNCTVEYTQRENDRGRDQDCVVVTCGECEHAEQSWGQGEGSVRRCLALLKENCPNAETNYYKVSE